MKKSMLFILLIMILGTSRGQQIILDMPVRAGELTLFPDLNDQNKFYYVLDKARLATDENGKPEFSFIRYVDNVNSDEATGSMTEGGGGGIVHALVTLAVSPEQLQEAEQELKRLHPNATVEGPIIFKSGRFALVTSFTTANGELTKSLVGVGNAPILDGQKAAISMYLTKRGSQLLWESFKTATPDISFSFEMTMEGFRLPKRAIIEANYEEIYKRFDMGIQAGYTLGGDSSNEADDKKEAKDDKETKPSNTENSGNSKDQAQPKKPSKAPQPENPNESSQPEKPSGSNNQSRAKANKNRELYLGFELQQTFEELKKSGAITITQYGSDEDMDALIASAYAKLADLMFDRVENNSGQQPNPQQMLNQLANTQQDKKQTPLNGVLVSFKFKKNRRSGTFRYDLNKWSNDQIVLRFDEPVGNLSRYQDDPNMFHQFNMEDPLYQQREIVSMIDGYNAQDFGNYINFVSVRLRKMHATGKITDREIQINRKNFNKTGNAFSMMYGWDSDQNRRKWMEYQYEVLWSFFGDVEVKQDLKTASFNTINLAPPYQKKVVNLEADPTLLAEQEVRTVIVKLYYTVEGKEFMKQATLVPSRNQLSKQLEYIAPPNDLNYEYEITWRLKGNRALQSGRQQGTDDYLFVDELPEG